MSSHRAHGLRLGVVGLGAMGRRHLQAARRLEGVEVVGVADPSYAEHQPVDVVQVVPSLDALVELGLDACVVATPSPDHVAAAVRLAAAGVHTLIEKPVALGLEDCQRISASFAGSGLVVRVGHVERFNPALLALRREVHAGTVGALQEISTRREDGPPRRSDGGDVLLDLGTHDFDLVAWLMGQPMEVASCSTATVGCAPSDEAVTVELTLTGGVVCRHSLSWHARQRVRTVTVRGTSGERTVDSLHDAQRRSASSGTAGHDPLTAQLRAWCDLIAGRADPADPRCGASLEDGVRAVAVAHAVMSSRGRPD